MKKIILLILILLELFIIPIPEYVELNNLAIIEEVILEEKNNQYTLILKEKIPLKDDQGISYKYKTYKETSSTINSVYQNIKNKTKKKLYLSKVKSLYTNYSSPEEITNLLDISPSSIKDLSLCK